MDNPVLKQRLEEMMPDAGFPANPQFPEIVVPRDRYHDFCRLIKSSPDLMFDYLISLTAIDWSDHFMIVCHITSTCHRHTLVVKTRLEGREELSVQSISDLWKTAEYHEREVFDLFGIRFLDHPDLRRLFLEDNYGYPLRKDFTDETRMIVR